MVLIIGHNYRGWSNHIDQIRKPTACDKLHVHLLLYHEL